MTSSHHPGQGKKGVDFPRILEELLCQVQLTCGSGGGALCSGGRIGLWHTRKRGYRTAQAQQLFGSALNSAQAGLGGAQHNAEVVDLVLPGLSSTTVPGMIRAWTTAYEMPNKKTTGEGYVALAGVDTGVAMMKDYVGGARGVPDYKEVRKRHS